MGEITTATTFDHVRALRFNPTQRRTDDLDDPTVFAPPPLNDGDLKALARQAAVDKNHATIVSAG